MLKFFAIIAILIGLVSSTSAQCTDHAVKETKGVVGLGETVEREVDEFWEEVEDFFVKKERCHFPCTCCKGCDCRKHKPCPMPVVPTVHPTPKPVPPPFVPYQDPHSYWTYPVYEYRVDACNPRLLHLGYPLNGRWYITRTFYRW